MINTEDLNWKNQDKPTDNELKALMPKGDLPLTLVAEVFTCSREEMRAAIKRTPVTGTRLMMKAVTPEEIEAAREVIKEEIIDDSYITPGIPPFFLWTLGQRLIALYRKYQAGDHTAILTTLSSMFRAWFPHPCMVSIGFC
jgi:hypothetical protein